LFSYQFLIHKFFTKIFFHFDYFISFLSFIFNLEIFSLILLSSLWFYFYSSWMFVFYISSQVNFPFINDLISCIIYLIHFYFSYFSSIFNLSSYFWVFFLVVFVQLDSSTFKSFLTSISSQFCSFTFSKAF
jgi:hypothetical protein